ncbi:MAG: hypothetical protein HFG37_13485 [Eubacterium sp.]|nr:hypothetical protein [Eubacterium sp.]MCI9411320.1 hypothetical protein [Eubacterium sp.]
MSNNQTTDQMNDRINDPIKNSVTNCHRTKKRPVSESGANDNSDQDSSTTKYVVQDDQRERRDGPGGN